VADGVPDSAFIAIEGDHKPTVTARRKANARQRAERQQGMLNLTHDPSTLSQSLAKEMDAIEALPDTTPGEVAAKAARYAEHQRSLESQRARLAADAWCAAFVAVKDKDHPAITDSTVRVAAESPAGLE